mgnify:CR=1 FL=1
MTNSTAGFPGNASIGIAGYGFVGRATAHLFQGQHRVLIHDTRSLEELAKAYGPGWYCGLQYVDTLKELAKESDYLFVCVPTPMKPDGSCDVSIVERVVAEVLGSETVVVLRSTVPPGTTDRLRGEDGALVYCPEFITEKNWKHDAEYPDRILVGGREPWCTCVGMLFQRAHAMVASTKRAANPFAHASIPYLLMLESGEAELAKLASNAFLAAKVAFFNEVACLAGRLGLEYEKVREAITCDQRIGASHSMVPGHDGDRGFGGSCLPKDTSDLLDVMRRHGTPSAVVRGALSTNLAVRRNRDWMQMKGRAVTE